MVVVILEPERDAHGLPQEPRVQALRPGPHVGGHQLFRRERGADCRR